MYETIKKRRIKVTLFTQEAQKEDLRLQREAKELAEKENVSVNFNFQHPKGCGFRDFFGWFAGYGLDIYDTGETVTNHTAVIIEMDNGKIQLLHPNLVEFV